MAAQSTRRRGKLATECCIWTEAGAGGGNLLTQARYGDFELVFEWKLASGSNNGLKYRVNDFDGRFLGIEYQMIDEVAKPQRPKHRTASLYDIYEPREHDVLRLAGEFNRSRIVVCNNYIQHWLNGHLVTQATVGSEQWQQQIAESKFSDVEGFGVIPTGHIMLTDHGDEVWYRSLFIRQLDGPAQIRLARSRSVAKTRCVGRRRILFGRRGTWLRRR